MEPEIWVVCEECGFDFMCEDRDEAEEIAFGSNECPSCGGSEFSVQYGDGVF